MDDSSSTRGRMPTPRPKPKIFCDAETLEHAGHLVLDADPETPDRVRRLLGNLLPTEYDAPARGAKLTSDELEEGALARSVWTDQAAQLPAPHLEIDAGDCPDASKALLEALRFEHRLFTHRVDRRPPWDLIRAAG